MSEQTKLATTLEAEGDVAVEVASNLEDNMSHHESEQEQPQEETPDVKEPVKEPESEEVVDIPLSNREEKRVAKLIPKLKEESERANKAEQEATYLREMLTKKKEELYSPQTSSPSPNPFDPNQFAPQMPIIEGEITPEQYQRDLAQTARTISQLEIAGFKDGARRLNNLETDIKDLKEKYEPTPDVEKTISELYLKASETNPDLRFREFAEPILVLHQAGQEAGKQQVTPSIAQQEAEGAIPPGATSGRKSEGIDPANMSAAQAEQWLKENGMWDSA